MPNNADIWTTPRPEHVEIANRVAEEFREAGAETRAIGIFVATQCPDGSCNYGVINITSLSQTELGHLLIMVGAGMMRGDIRPPSVM